LDIGCGRGYTLAWLARWGADVYGTQLSATAAETAKQLIGTDRVFVGELSEAGFADQRFDAVTLWHVLEHTPDPLAVLREVSRILKPTGLLYIEVPNAGGWSARTFGRHWLAYDVPKHLMHFTPKTLEATARQAGFTCIKQVHSSLEYSPATLLQSALSAWLGGEHLLFRLASHETPLENLRRQMKTACIILHAVVAVFLAVPAIFLSLFLSRRRQGDTMGFYFRHA
jgi:SAM-dependent methyltransferase